MNSITYGCRLREKSGVGQIIYPLIARIFPLKKKISIALEMLLCELKAFKISLTHFPTPKGNSWDTYHYEKLK